MKPEAHSVHQADPINILDELRNSARELDAMSVKLSRLTKQFGTTIDKETGEVILGPGIRYDIAIKEKRTQIYDHAIENDKRPPAEDIRGAKAERMLREDQPELWNEYQQLRTEMDALRISISARKNGIRARQSILKGERE